MQLTISDLPEDRVDFVLKIRLYFSLYLCLKISGKRVDQQRELRIRFVNYVCEGCRHREPPPWGRQALCQRQRFHAKAQRSRKGAKVTQRRKDRISFLVCAFA